MNGGDFRTRAKTISPELHADIEVVKEVPSKRHAILRGENGMDPACRGRKKTDFEMRHFGAGPGIATMPGPAETAEARGQCNNNIDTVLIFRHMGVRGPGVCLVQLGQQTQVNGKNKLVNLRRVSGSETPLLTLMNRTHFRRDKVKESRVGGWGWWGFKSDGQA